MFTAKIFCDLFSNSDYATLLTALENGQLDNVKWSWVTRLNPNISLEDAYLKVTNTLKPLCKVCNKNPVSTFISFSVGYNHYCSKSCAKKDPDVQRKKEASLLKNPNWKETAAKKAKATNQQKYGFDTPLKNKDILQKRKETNLRLYGSTEVLSSSSAIREKITSEIAVNKVFSRIDSFSHVIPLFTRGDFTTADNTYAWKCLGCSSVFSATLNDGNIPRCTRCHPRTSSSGENELRKFVERLLPKEEVIQRYKLNGKTEIDIFIPTRKIGIEFNGIYWHSEGKGTSKNYHLAKKTICRDNGIRLLQFWDTQWFAQQEIVKSIISGTLGLNRRVYARNCQLLEVSEKESAHFLETNHLSGNARGSFSRLGLYQNDALICLATFSKPRYEKHKPGSIELLRFCTAHNISCVGGASKILKAAISFYNPTKIISFCDEMCFSGEVYNRLGFVKISPGNPAPWYFSGDGVLKHRTTYQKKKLLKLLKIESSPLTEWELAQQLKLNRVWDCGNSKWELDVGSVS